MKTNKIKSIEGDEILIMAEGYDKGFEEGKSEAKLEFEELIDEFFGAKTNWVKKPETALNKALVILCSAWKEELKAKLKEAKEK